MLQDNPDMTQREIAEKLGISTSGLNYCLTALIDNGWVKMQNFSRSKNKFGYVYVLTPQAIAEKASVTGHFLQRKLKKYHALRLENKLFSDGAEIDEVLLAGVAEANMP